jgi:hypothetical protein
MLLEEGGENYPFKRRASAAVEHSGDGGVTAAGDGGDRGCAAGAERNSGSHHEHGHGSRESVHANASMENGTSKSGSMWTVKDHSVKESG